MRLKESFEVFLTDTVNLDRTRLDRVISAHNTIRDKITELDAVRVYLVATYLQGSYALRTAIRPPNENAEYDVDVILALILTDENDDLLDGMQVLDWLYGILEDIPLYKGKVERRGRCIRVQYTSDGQRFHLDLLPAHQPVVNDEPILIPPDWAQTNPRGYMRWLNELQRKHCERVRHIVRLLKYWRGLHFPNGLVAPNSMVLTTLVGLHAPKDGAYKSLDDALFQTMASINQWFQNLPAFEQVVVANPSLGTENLARDWTWSEITYFRDAFAEATTLTQEAINCKDEKETIEIWNDKRLFDDRFPKTMRGLDEEAKAAAHAVSNGGLYAMPTGFITLQKSAGGVPVPNNHGYYGREER